MKKKFKNNIHVFFRQRNLFIVMLVLITSCANEKKNWEQAQQLNTIEEYQNFLEKYPSGEFSEKASIIIDSLAWVAASTSADTAKISSYIKTNNNGLYVKNAEFLLDSIYWHQALNSGNVETINEFILKNSNSIYIVEAEKAIDSLKFETVLAVNTVKSIKTYIKDNPNSAYVEKAKEKLWEMQWPPVDVKDADLMFIYKNGRSLMRSTTSPNGGNGYRVSSFLTSDIYMKSTGNIVVIWRNFSDKEKVKANQQGLRTGLAYLKTSNGLKFIKKVNLNKSDSQLCSDFGIK